MDATLLTDLAARTRELREQGLYKNERILVSPQNAAIRVEGHRWASARFSVEASADAHIRAFDIACGRASRRAVA